MTAFGPSRNFAVTQQLGRIWSEADIERFSVRTEPVAFDPKRHRPAFHVAVAASAFSAIKALV